MNIDNASLLLQARQRFEKSVQMRRCRERLDDDMEEIEECMSEAESCLMALLDVKRVCSTHPIRPR